MYRLTLSRVASRVWVMTSNSSPVWTANTSVCRSPSASATIRSVTHFTGWEMERANRRIISTEIIRPARVARMETSMAPLITWL